MTEKNLPDITYTRIKRSTDYSMEPHFHNNYEIYYLVSGNRRIFINNKIYDISKGDFVLAERNVLHKTTYSTKTANNSHERVCIRFNIANLAPFIDEFGEKETLEMFKSSILNIPLNARKELMDLFDKLDRNINSPDKFSALSIKAALQQILVFYLRFKNISNTEIPQSLTANDIIIQKAANYIADNYTSDITLNSISDYIGISSTYFSKRFKDATGFGFKEYLLNLRINHSVSLLLQTTDTITEVAYKCGFNDSNYFGDVFKKHKGVSPLQFRKRYNK